MCKAIVDIAIYQLTKNGFDQINPNYPAAGF
jgi:hypothetical protein